MGAGVLFTDAKQEVQILVLMFLHLVIEVMQLDVLLLHLQRMLVRQFRLVAVCIAF